MPLIPVFSFILFLLLNSNSHVTCLIDLLYHSRIHCMWWLVDLFMLTRIQNQQPNRYAFIYTLIFLSPSFHTFIINTSISLIYIFFLFYAFRLPKYIVSLLKHFRIFLKNTRAELVVQPLSWKLFEKTKSSSHLYLD